MRHDIISEKIERYVYMYFNSSSLDTPIRIQIPSFYNHENNNKFPISTYAKYVILQRFLTNNFVVVYPSLHVWNELSNEELDCKCEVCVVHASHARTCASPELSNPSDIDSDRTETLSEISSSGESTVAPSTVDSDVTVEPSNKVSESENSIEKQSFTVKRGHASTDSSSSGSSKSVSILKRKKNHK